MGPPPGEREQEAEAEAEVEAADTADAGRSLLLNAAATPGGDHGINSEPSRHRHAAAGVDAGDGGGGDALEDQGGGLVLSRTLTFLDGVGVIIGIMVGGGRWWW